VGLAASEAENQSQTHAHTPSGGTSRLKMLPLKIATAARLIVVPLVALLARLQSSGALNELESGRGGEACRVPSRTQKWAQSGSIDEPMGQMVARNEKIIIPTIISRFKRKLDRQEAARKQQVSPSGGGGGTGGPLSNGSIPEFAGPIGNVTAVLGRDVRLVCTVDNLGSHQASVPAREGGNCVGPPPCALPLRFHIIF